MTINLMVLPLEDVAKIDVMQKCILPAEVLCLTNLSYQCGTWMRCVLKHVNNNRKCGYVICQVYQQTSCETLVSNAAYIDRAVTVDIQQHEYTQRLKGTELCQLEPLKEASVKELELAFTINMDFLSKAGKINLLKIAKLHLQAYCLTNRCTVRSRELQHLGIMAVDVTAKALSDEYHCYRIADETQIRMVDVHLEAPLASLKVFHTIGYESVLQELNELIYRYMGSCCLRANLNALIVGPMGCGKSATIAHFVQKNYCNYFSISMETLLGQYPGEAEAKMREVFAAARTFVKFFKPKAPTIIHLEDLHLLCPTVKVGSKDSGNSLRLCAQLNSLLDSLNASKLNIICLATTTDAKLLHKSLLSPGRFQNEININPPNDMTRRSLFRLLFADRLPLKSMTENILDTVVAQTSGYVIADLAMIVRAVEQALLHQSTPELATLISEIMTKSKPASIYSANVTVIKSVAGFDSIGGMQALKDTLTLNVLTGLTRVTAYKRFGLSLPKGILLYGPPGCAKTTIAKCLAAEAKMTFIATSGAEVYSPYVGCAEKFITKLFDTARKHAPCLVFLDEIDTLVGCRALGVNANDIQTRILSTLLTEMDGIVHTRRTASVAYILVVAATNRPQMIDDALLRPGRFDQLIHVPAPDRDSRLSILELHKLRMPFAEDCDLLDIAERTHNYSGADLCNLCNEAAMHTLLRDINAVEITNADFESVLRTQKASLTQRQIDSYLQFQKRLVR